MARTQLNDTIKNKTSKIFYYDVNVEDMGSRGDTLKGNDSILLEFVAERKVKTSILAWEYFPNGIRYQKCELYNLSDTTFMDIEKWRYKEEVKHNVLSKDTKWLSKRDRYYENVIIVNDSLLAYMQKDTGMLNKFKNYYTKSIKP
jgi:hypothetical protein